VLIGPFQSSPFPSFQNLGKLTNITTYNTIPSWHLLLALS
jgi:hypothetical protein